MLSKFNAAVNKCDSKKCRTCLKIKSHSKFGKTWKRIGGKVQQYFRKKCLACCAVYRNDIQKPKNLLKKKLVMQTYGDGKCQCCGEKHLEFLTVDHIGGQKTKLALGHSKKGSLNGRKISGGLLYHILIQQNFPYKDKLRVLCCNCNQATQLDKICPHQKEVI